METVNFKALAPSQTITGLSIREFGKMGSNLARAAKSGRTELLSREIILMVRKWVAESSSGQMVVFTQVSSWTINYTAKVCISGQMEENIEVCGRRTK